MRELPELATTELHVLEFVKIQTGRNANQNVNAFKFVVCITLTLEWQNIRHYEDCIMAVIFDMRSWVTRSIDHFEDRTRGQ